ncbi:hypothetical protein AGABI1DRAFT_124801 [Agaricus bisporus var. burnettii JB137-S8]|uniref:Nascent polypeptide-associated complex subunit alpha-like UBA domain-containing protein n=2 Tax=Agaricus bisporus var. burnettii TaxID=192524 RepID=K5W663_AGABU|nr:hypothetical protein AGABI2DRAFT_148310 [Agaricus bisporus var. bisporus H97]XP_007326365.1 uncharacterized protein AGABI1DRAFT_124801 [Agaricus bisporus var. burnettii JB137-S8]EKM82319.1 hypothetical protein AGABI1DRAFT_124801 [Agaricus bisporus var. burnettii JB137-S8]EKV49711.1 hypothetical protein AGABI2DRAFT_148310 [Agaricus bisporus var. bisporus H97]KAF7778427.1 hypothetical protein Agabi119p4_2772 [Agaricus bisporus var. burnettii]
MARSNGRPEPEVIMNFVDGFNYVKARVEDAYRPGGILEKAPPKVPRDPALSTLKREDVDLVVHEFEIPRAQAEKALLQNGGDVGRTIRALITPRSTDFLSNA